MSRTAERSIWERRSICLAISEHSIFDDSASSADLRTRSASMIGSESSSWMVFSSSAAMILPRNKQTKVE